MAITYTFSIAENFSELSRAIIDGLEGQERAGINQSAAVAARDAAVKYHKDFDAVGKWRGKRYLGAVPSEGTDFGSSVSERWQVGAVDKEAVTISNDARFYAFKVTGGTITPKRAKFLTIPLIQEAKGLYASVYTQNTGRRLFTIKGHNALFERTDAVVTGARGRRGQEGSSQIKTRQIRAVYALKRSVTMGPWPGAVPPDDVLSAAFIDEFKARLDAISDQL